MSNTFKNLIDENTELAIHKQDIGLQKISDDIDWKIKKSKEKNRIDINELYYPTKRQTLLAKLMYQNASLYFRKPMSIFCEMKSDVDTTIEANTKFSDGQDIYLNPEAIVLEAEVYNQWDCSLIRHEIITKEIFVDSNQRYFKVPTGMKYSEFYKCEVILGNKQLIISQNFIARNSEVSLECDLEENITIVILKGHKGANDITTGTSLKVKLYKTNGVDTPPTGLSVIGTQHNLIVDKIIMTEAPIELPDNEYLKNELRYNRNFKGDILTNGDYKSLIIKNVANITEIKVWQQREELNEHSFDIGQINTVYVSFVADDLDRAEITANIKNVINRTIRGKDIIVREPLLKTIKVAIRIKLFQAISNEQQTALKESLIGVFDDTENKISYQTLYKKVFEFVKDNYIQETFEIAINDNMKCNETGEIIPKIDIQKGDYINRQFFIIGTEDICIEVIQDDI